MARITYSDFYPQAELEGVMGSTVPIISLTTLNEIEATVSGISDDTVITVDEKSRILLPLMIQLDANLNALISRAVTLGVNYSLASTWRDNWLAYLNSLDDTPPGNIAWDDTSGPTTNVDRAVFSNILDQYIQQIAALQATISEEDAKRAEWPSVEDPEGTKPDDNATEGAPPGTPVGDKPAEVVISDQRSAAETLIEKTLNSYKERKRVIAQLYLNGRPIRAIAEIISEARVDANGNAFAKAGFEVDANGVVGGLFLTSDGSVVELKLALDKMSILRPGTTGANSNDVLFSLSGNTIIMHNVEVDTLKIGSVSATEMALGSTGDAAGYYRDTAVSVNSTSTWVELASVTITPTLGKPVELAFSSVMTCTNAPSTRVKLKVTRDDGTSIWGGTAGVQERIPDEGKTTAFECLDATPEGRVTTYKVLCQKSVNTENVDVTYRLMRAASNSRHNWQQFNVVSTESGAGPGAGSGGAGSGYNPNKFVVASD